MEQGKEREAFEVWAKKEGYDLDCRLDTVGNYKDSDAYFGFQCYLAGAALSAGEAQQGPLTDEWVDEAFDSFCRHMSLVKVLYREDAQKFARAIEARAALTAPRHMVAREDDDPIMDGDPLFHKTSEQIESELSAPHKEAMTDEQIQTMWHDACQDGPGRPGWSRHIRFARAIITALPNAPHGKSEDQVIADFLDRTGQYVTNDTTREQTISDALECATQPPHHMVADHVAEGGKMVADSAQAEPSIELLAATARAAAFESEVLALRQSAAQEAGDAVFAELLDAYEAVFRSAYCQLDADDGLIARARAELERPIQAPEKS